MAIAERNAQVTWNGTLAGGGGELSSGSGALDGAVTWAARTEAPDGKTSPEELIAAAHASCFAMAFALVLGEAKTPPQQLRVAATCTLDEVGGAPKITKVDLQVHAEVPGAERAAVEESLAKAADLCPVSNALRGNVEIAVNLQT